MAEEGKKAGGGALTLRISTACERGDVSRATINRAIKRGELNPIRKGPRMVLLVAAEFDSWLIRGATTNV